MRPPEADRIVARLPDLVNADAGLGRRGQRLTTTFLLAVGDTEYLLHVAEGRLAAVERGPFLLRYDDTAWLHRPDGHGGEVAAALMSGVIAPQAPNESRRETLWMSAQGGPSVFRGDLHFYRVEGDLRDRVDRIDTARCPLYLLTGEYDFSCTPDDTRETAARIRGARLTIMRELGHFPMREHPERFRTYLLPVLGPPARSRP